MIASRFLPIQIARNHELKSCRPRAPSFHIF